MSLSQSCHSRLDLESRLNLIQTWIPGQARDDRKNNYSFFAFLFHPPRPTFFGSAKISNALSSVIV